MNKTYKIIIAIALLFYSASCKNYISEEIKGVCFTAIQDTLKHNAVPIQIGLNKTGYSIYRETSKAPVPKVSSTTYKRQSENLPSQISKSDRNKDQNPKNLENPADSYVKELSEKKETNKEQKSTETLEGKFQQSRLATVSNGMKESVYKQDAIEDNENLKEWLDTFMPKEENGQNETIEDSSILENNQFLYNSRNEAAVCENEVSSSCLPPPAASVILKGDIKEPAKLADKLIFRTPQEKLSDKGGNRKIDRGSMGEVLPTSLQDTYELIIKVDKLKAEIIEKRKSEGIPFDKIIEEIGLSVLIENNTVLDITRVNIPYKSDEEYILHKITFAYSLSLEDYKEIKEDKICDELKMSFEPNYFVKNMTLEANLYSNIFYDKLILHKWAIHEINEDGVKGIEEILKNTPKEGVIVAVIDTGIDYTLQELEDAYWVNEGEIPDNGIDDDNNGYVDDGNGWNFVDNNNDIMDYDCHGTNVARIINEIIGSSKIMVVKALTSEGGKSLDLYSAVKYAVDNGARVINLSWGGDIESELINEAVDYAFNHNVVIVAAAGNSSGDISLFPAENPKVISVMGTNMFSNSTYYTNRGADIFAPGNNIYLEGVGYISGTSYSAPFVSGAAAQLLSRFPNEKINPIEVLYRLKSEAYLGTKLLNISKDFVDLNSTNIQRGVMCSIISAKPKDGIIEIKVLAKYASEEYGSENCVFSLDYAEGLNPSYRSAWGNITKIYKDSISENEIFYWDTRNLPGGYYTVRLAGYSYKRVNGKIVQIDQSRGIMDMITVKIDNQLNNNEYNEYNTTYLFNTFCKIDDTNDAYIEIISPYNNDVEITPIFYINTLRYGGSEVSSPLTSVINEEGIYIIDLKRYLPGTIGRYEGPIGLEVKNYSPDIKISIKLINKNLGTTYYERNFIGGEKSKYQEKNILGASWSPYIHTVTERENYKNDYFKWCDKVEKEGDWELKNNLNNMPKIQKEARLVLYNSTDEDASVNITLYADGKLFDTKYKVTSSFWWGESLGDGYHFFKIKAFGKNAGPYADLYYINDSRKIFFWEESEQSVKEVEPYWQLMSRYTPYFIYCYTLLSKLDGYNNQEDGVYDIKWSSLTIPASISIPARSYINIPTWSFLTLGYDVPINYFCANACIVTNIYPKGTVYGAVVQEKDGIAEEIIPLQPSSEILPSVN